MAQDLGARADRDRVDIVAMESVLRAQLADALHRGVRGDVTGIALDADALGLELAAQAAREELGIRILAIRLEETMRAPSHVGHRRWRAPPARAMRPRALPPRAGAGCPARSRARRRRSPVPRAVHAPPYRHRSGVSFRRCRARGRAPPPSFPTASAS